MNWFLVVRDRPGLRRTVVQNRMPPAAAKQASSVVNATVASTGRQE